MLSTETAEEFIKEGLAKDEDDKKSSTDAGDKNVPPTDRTTADHDTAANGDDAGQHG